MIVMLLTGERQEYYVSQSRSLYHKLLLLLLSNTKLKCLFRILIPQDSFGEVVGMMEDGNNDMRERLRTLQQENESKDANILALEKLIVELEVRIIIIILD